jgi:hypothetical protein
VQACSIISVPKPGRRLHNRGPGSFLPREAHAAAEIAPLNQPANAQAALRAGQGTVFGGCGFTPIGTGPDKMRDSPSLECPVERGPVRSAPDRPEERGEGRSLLQLGLECGYQCAAFEAPLTSGVQH